MTNSKQRMIIRNKKADRPTPYQTRSDLTQDEVRAINHYKDLVNPQYEWDFKPVPEKDVGIDCQIINGVLRRKYSKDLLSRRDNNRVSRTVGYINSAIKKSRLSKNLPLIKGIKQFKGLSSYKVGMTITEYAFGSYTTNPKVATRYSGKNSKSEYIYFTVELRAGDKALYVDADEEEWILKTRCKFIVTDIEHGAIEGHKAIIYHLELIT